jgi:hypothetical protein
MTDLCMNRMRVFALCHVMDIAYFFLVTLEYFYPLRLARVTVASFGKDREIQRARTTELAES